MDDTYLQSMIARPHPQCPNAYLLTLKFSDGTERQLDRGAYNLQPAQHLAESFATELIIEKES